jgi:hypothetical protein
MRWDAHEREQRRNIYTNLCVFESRCEAGKGGSEGFRPCELRTKQVQGKKKATYERGPVRGGYQVCGIFAEKSVSKHVCVEIWFEDVA